MELVRDQPELEAMPFESSFAQDYGKFDSVADVIRRMALDEREHKAQSLARLGKLAE